MHKRVSDTLIITSREEDSPSFIADETFSDSGILVLRPTKRRVPRFLVENGLGVHYFYYEGVPIRLRLQILDLHKNRFPQLRLVSGGTTLLLSCRRRGFRCHGKRKCASGSGSFLKSWMRGGFKSINPNLILRIIEMWSFEIDPVEKMIWKLWSTRPLRLFCFETTPSWSSPSGTNI